MAEARKWQHHRDAALQDLVNRMQNYYSEKLSAKRLKRCYEIAPARVRQYFQAEIQFVLERIQKGDSVLDLGCGYGRVITDLLLKAGSVTGVDRSLESISTAIREYRSRPEVELVCADALSLPFTDGSFDLTICIQNGISAFHVDQKKLLLEAMRVTRPGGMALFSTYSSQFWNDRLDWFQLQAEEGLIGEIDEEKTKQGDIVCLDGFRATTVSLSDFELLAVDCDLDLETVEVDQSSLFALFTRR